MSFPVCDTESALVSAREEVSETFETVDDKEVLLEDVEINDRTDSDPNADEAVLNEKEDSEMNEINKSFRRFFSNIGLRLTVKQGTDEQQAETASDELPNGEEEPSSLGDTCDTANKSASETGENNADQHMAQDSADNESTTCPTVTDMTSEDIQENVEDKTTAATEVEQKAAEETLAHADTEDVTTSGAEPEASSPQDSAEEEVLSPIKVFFTTGIFSSLGRKKKTAEEEKQNETNDKELVDMVRQELGGTEEVGKDLAKDEVCQSVERAVVEEKQPTEEGNEEVILESAPTTNGHGIRENLLTANEELLSSQEKVSSSLCLLSGKVSKKQRGRKKSSDSTERVSDHLQSSVESAKSTTEESPAVAPVEVKEESAWESFKRLLTPKKFQRRLILSNEEAVISSTPNEPKPSEGEEIDVSTDECRKRKDSIVSWDALLCGSGNRKSRKNSNADEQKPKAEGDDTSPASELKHATDLDSSHERDENLASSPEQGGSPSEDEGSTWKSFKRLVTPKRKSRVGEETKEHTSDSEIIQDESSFSLTKFLPGRKKRRPSEKQEQVPSDEPEREEQSDEEDSETPAVIPLSECDTPETESQGKTLAVIESQTPEPEDYEGQEEVTGQTTEAIIMSDSTPALPEETKDTETALENPTSMTPASMKEVDDLTEFISKLQQLSDIPEEGLIEESVATPASFTEDAARDDTIADIMEFTSEAVTAPEPIDTTAEDETEMVSATSQLTSSSKTSGNTTPVPAEYDVKETDDLLHQVVESIFATPDEALVSASDQIPERIAASVSRQILETSILKEPTILQPHKTSDVTLLCTGLTVEAFGAIDKDVVMAETECLSEMMEAISTQCLSEDTTEEFHTAGISVDEELKYIHESQPGVNSSSEENKTMNSEVSPQADDVHVAEISIEDHNNDDEQANEMTPPGTDSHVEATIKTDNEALSQTNEVLEDNYDQIKESTTNDEAQVQIDEMVDESETLTLTISINSEEVSGAQADEMPATSEATQTDETVKGTDLLSGEEMRDVTKLSVGDEEQHELFVVMAAVAEVEHVPVSAPVEPEEVVIEADKSNSQLQSCSSVDVEQAEQSSVQELESQSITEDIPLQDITVPEGEGVSVEHMQHTPLETETYIKEEVAEILQDAQVQGGDQTTEVRGELQVETSVEETVDEESNVQVLEHKVITEDSPALEEEQDDEKESVTQPEQLLTEKDRATVENDPMEVPQEDDEMTEVTDELETLTSLYVASVISDASIVHVLEKQLIIEDNAESQAEDATSEVEKEAAIMTEEGLAEKELVSIENDPCDEHRHVLVQEDGQLTEVTDEFETSQSVHVGTLNSESIIVEGQQKQIISEDIGSNAENAKTLITVEDEKEIVIQSEQSLLEKEFVTVENDLREVPQHIPVEDHGQIIEVTNELEELTAVHVASVNCDASPVQSFEKQAVAEDNLESHAENALASTSEVVKEAAIVTEQGLVEKEIVSIENDSCDVTKELETLNSLHVASVHLEVDIAQELQKQVLMEDNAEVQAENALPSFTSEVEKEAATVSEHNVADKELVSIENDSCNVPRQVLVQEDGEMSKVTDELETLTSLYVASVISDASIVQLLEKPVITEDNAESLAEDAKSEIEKEAAIVTEQGLAEKELVSLENDPCDVPRQVLVQEDGKLTEVTDELEILTSVHVGALKSESRIIEVHEKQVTSEDLGSNAENAKTLIMVEHEKETVTQSEQSLLEKELVTVERNLSDEPQHISVTEDVQVAEVTMELETSACAHVASSVEVLENQVVSEDILVPNRASVPAEVENETGVLIEQALVQRNLPTKEDGEVVKVSEFESPPTLQIAPLISESGIVEVIEKPVTSEDLGSNAENAKTIIEIEDEKVTVTQSEQSLLEKDSVTVESNLSEEPKHISDVQVAEDTKDLEASTSGHVASVESNAGIGEVLEKQVVSEDIPVPVGASASVTDEVENETGVLIEQALVERNLPTMDNDHTEIPQQSVVEEDGEVVKVSEFESPPTLQIAPLISESGIVEVIKKPVTSEDLGSNAENAKKVIGIEDEKETVTQSEQSFLEKELVTVESDLSEKPQHISVTDDVQVTEVAKELQASTFASVDSNDGIAEVLEKQVESEDLGSNAENASSLITVEDEKETVTQSEQSLLEKDSVTVESDLSEEVKHISDVQVAEDTKDLEASTSGHDPSVEVIEEQLTFEDLGSNAENVNTVITVEDEKETVTQSEQSLLEKELVSVESNCEKLQHISVTDDVQVAEVTKELEASTSVYVASVDSNAGIIEVLETQVVSEDIPVPIGASASVTAEVENEGQEDGKLTEVTDKLEILTSVHVGALNSESRIIEVHEKQVTSEDLGSNAENAKTLIMVEHEKETVTQSEQSLPEKELVTVESNLSDEPQHISVTEDVQVAEVTMELETSSCAHEASSVEVLEKQVVSEDIPVPVEASALMRAEVEHETGVLIEQALAQRNLPTKEDGEVVKVSEFESPPTLQIAPLISESGIVEVIEKPVTSEDLGSNAENAKTVIEIEDEKVTVTQSEQSFLEKELVTVESDLSEEPQHISVTDDVQVTEVAKELEASTFASVDSNDGIAEVLEKQVESEDLGSNAENASSLITVEDEKETVTQSEQSLLEKDSVTVESDLSEEPKHIADVQVAEDTKELEASTSGHDPSVDSNASIGEVLVKQVVSEDLLVPVGASASVTDKVENETEVLTEEALVVKELPTLDDQPNEMDKVSTECEAPPSLQIAPRIAESIIVEVIEEQLTFEDLGSNTENVNTVAEVTKELEASTFAHEASVDSNAGIIEVLVKQVVSEDISVPDGASALVTAGVENETGVLIEQALVVKELPTVDDDPYEIPQHAVVKEDGEVVKVFEAPPTVQIAQSSIVEVIEKNVLPEDIQVTDAGKASASTTAEAEKEAAILIEQALVEKELITVVDDPNEVPRQCTVKNNDQLADVTNVLDGSTAVHIASITSDTSTQHALSEAIPAPDTENALDSVTVEVMNRVVVLTEHAIVEKEIQTKEGDPNEVPKHSAVKNNDQLAEVTEILEVPTAVNTVSIAPEISVPKVIEKPLLSENISAPDTENNVALEVPEPSHDQVPTGVNIEGDIHEPAEKEEESNAEVVEDDVAMQEEEGAATEALTCGAKYVKTSTPDDANTQTPNITDPSLVAVATEAEHQETMEPVRVLQPFVRQDMTEVAEEIKGEVDAEVESVEEVGVTDANENMDVGCKVENEGENVPTSLATKDQIMGETNEVTAKEVDQQEQQTQASEEEAKEESCSETEPAEQAITPPTEQKATEITQSELSELEDHKVTENKSDARMERSVTEIVIEEELASPHVLATTDDASIDEPKTDLEETKVELKKESDVHVIEEEPSCSPDVLAVKETIEAKQEQTYSCQVVTPSNTGIVAPQNIISSEKVQPTIKMEVTELQVKQQVEPTIKMEVIELQVKQKVEPTIKIEVTELQAIEKVEPTIKMEVTELQAIEKVEQNIKIVVTETKELPEVVIQAIEAIEKEVSIDEPKTGLEEPKVDVDVIEDSYTCQVITPSEEGETIKVEVTEIQLMEKVQPKIQMEVTVLQRKEKVEPTIKIEATEIQVTEKETAETEMKDSTQPKQPDVGVQAAEAVEPVRAIKMAEVAESLKEPGVSEVAATQIIEVTGLAKELDSPTRESILVDQLSLQVCTQQVETMEPPGSVKKAVILSQTVLSHWVGEPVETPAHLVHTEPAGGMVRSSPLVQSSQLVQSEVGLAKPVRRGEEELEQDVWLDAKEDIIKQEGPEKSEIEPQVSESQVESSQSDTEEAQFLDTTEHAPLEGEGSPEERPTVRAICELESEGEDFAIALEDPAVMNLTEMSVVCKELD